MGKWIDLGNGRKRFVVEEKPKPRKFGTPPHMTVNSVAGTHLDNIDLYGSKMGSTAVTKQRMKTLRQHGKDALNRTFRR